MVGWGSLLYYRLDCQFKKTLISKKNADKSQEYKLSFSTDIQNTSINIETSLDVMRITNSYFLMFKLKPEEELKYIEVNRKWRYEDNSTSDELVDASCTSCDEEEDKISPDEVDTLIPSSQDGVDFEGLLKNKTELEYFQSFLESRHRQGGVLTFYSNRTKLTSDKIFVT